MSKQNKWSGNMGKVASGGSSTGGGNTYNAPKAGPAPRSSSSIRDNVINCETGPGDDMGTRSISTHNDINAFTRGIKSRGPYGGPSFSSINSSKQNMQRSDTSGISKFPTPSGGGSMQTGTAGGSGKGMTSSPSRTQEGSVRGSKQTMRASVKNGSGYQNLGG